MFQTLGVLHPGTPIPAAPQLFPPELIQAGVSVLRLIVLITRI